MKKTIAIIGDAIIQGSRYLPIRNRAAALATTANPKDYLGQAKAIFDDFIKRWRYVKDPFGRELVTKSPEQIYKLVMGGRSTDPGVGLGMGAGDCDDAAAAIGAQLVAIGMPVKLCVSAPIGASAGPLMSHIFVQAAIPGHGWVTVDPVVWPRHGFGYTSPHSRLACYDLTGKLLQTSGNVRGLAGENFQKKGEKKMSQYQQQIIPDLEQWQDLSLAGVDYDPYLTEPLDFSKYGIKGFGCYSGSMGIISGIGLGLAAEVETELTPSGEYRAWTPALEVSPEDFNFVKRYGFAYPGMLALGDNGAIYEYDGTVGRGFFKKLFKKIRGGVKAIGRGIKKGVKAVGKLGKKFLKKLPGGKYLLKLGEKVFAIAKKLVGPLAKFVGKYAAKLAPVAALIPGYGPAIAAGLATAGKIAKLMIKHRVMLTGKKGTVRKLKFKSPQASKAFRQELEREAKQHQLAAKLRRGRAGVKVAARKPAKMRPLPFGRRFPKR